MAATIGTDEDTLLGAFHLGYNWQNGQQGRHRHRHPQHRISLGTEGLLYLFDEESVDFFAGGNPVARLKTDNDFYVVRARLTYHFH